MSETSLRARVDRFVRGLIRAFAWLNEIVDWIIWIGLAVTGLAVPFIHAWFLWQEHRPLLAVGLLWAAAVPFVVLLRWRLRTEDTGPGIFMLGCFLRSGAYFVIGLLVGTFQ